MDLLQIALIFLIVLLSIFLAITGFQVFLILRDLKKALDRLNKVLQVGENIVQDVEKPIEAAANLVNTLSASAKLVGDIVRHDPKPKPKRFYKKVL
jgi:hypothetical protein